MADFYALIGTGVLVLIVAGIFAALGRRTRAPVSAPRTTPSTPPPPRSQSSDRPQDDSIAPRNKVIRHLFFWTVVAFLTVIPSGLACGGLLLVIPETLGRLWIFGVFIALCAPGTSMLGKLLPKLTVWAPIAQAVVTINSITGGRVIYGGGLHPRLPWEEIGERSHQTLQQITLVHTESFDAQGTEMTVVLSYLIQPFLPLLDRFLYVDPATIDQSFTDRLRQFLSSLIAPMTPLHARQAPEYLSLKVANAFCIEAGDVQPSKEVRELEDTYGAVRSDRGALQSDRGILENRFGVAFTLFNIADIDFPDEVRKAMAAAAEALGMLRTMATLAGIDPSRVDTEPLAVAAELRAVRDYQELFKAARVMTDNSVENIITMSGGGGLDAAVAKALIQGA